MIFIYLFFVSYNDEGMTKIFGWKLSQQSCRNQGFVLDGYPKTKRQAWLLFAQEGESGDDETGPPADPELLPEYLLTLEVSVFFFSIRLSSLCLLLSCLHLVPCIVCISRPPPFIAFSYAVFFGI